MNRLTVSPTKSNLLLLERQLALAEEGYDLLEQKRQILLLELRQRLRLAAETEKRVQAMAHSSFEALREATLDVGSARLDNAVRATRPGHRLRLTDQRIVGLRLPRITVESTPSPWQAAPGERWSQVDAARLAFGQWLPLVASLAERSTAVLRLARELRRTQRRCNALSKIFIPDRRQAVTWIRATLEERERESLAVLKQVRDRVRAGH